MNEYADHVQYEANLENETDPKWVSQNRSTCRKKMYQYYIYIIYGKLGRSVRIPLPECVKNNVRRIFEDPNGEYMGFHEE